MKMKVGSPLVQQYQEKGSPYILGVTDDEILEQSLDMMFSN